MRITTQRSSLHAPTVAAAVRVTSWLRVPVVFVSSSRLSAAVRQVLEAQYDSFEKLEIGLALDGVLAPQGLHALSLQLVEDVSPIELDFTDFFCGIEAITEGCEE